MIQLKPGLTPSALNRPRSKSVRTISRAAKKKSKGLRFEVSVGADVPRVALLDPLRLKQILTNLLVLHAVKAVLIQKRAQG